MPTSRYLFDSTFYWFLRHFKWSNTIYYFQAFKFPDSMNVHFQCVVQVVMAMPFVACYFSMDIELCEYKNKKSSGSKFKTILSPGLPKLLPRAPVWWSCPSKCRSVSSQDETSPPSSLSSWAVIERAILALSDSYGAPAAAPVSLDSYGSPAAPPTSINPRRPG